MICSYVTWVLSDQSLADFPYNTRYDKFVMCSMLQPLILEWASTGYYMVANPAARAAEQGEKYSLSLFAPENLLARKVRQSRPPPAHSFSTARLNHQSSIINHQYGAYLRAPLPPPTYRGGVHLSIIPPYAIGSVPSVSGHATAYRWRLLPRVRRHRASSPQGSSSNGSY